MPTFAQNENYLQLCGTVLNILAHIIFDNDGEHACFQHSSFDVIMSIVQIILFGIWSSVPFMKETHVTKFIMKHYETISSWARPVSTAVQFVLGYLVNDPCEWEIKHLITFKPYWFLVTYNTCTFVACKLYKWYHKRKSQKIVNEPVDV